MPFRCLNCWKRTSLRFDECPKCQMFGTAKRVVTIDERDTTPTGGAIPFLAPTDDDEKRVQRFHVEADWDHALGAGQGGGLVRGAVVMVYGLPGAGKTTELLRLLAMTGGCYISSEETRDRLITRARVAGVDASNVAGYFSKKRRDVLAIIGAHTWPVIVIDSISALETERGYSEAGSQKFAMQTFVSAAAASRSSLLLVSHVYQHSGNAKVPAYVPHMVDAIVKVKATHLYVEKNRDGSFPISVRRKNRRLRIVERDDKAG